MTRSRRPQDQKSRMLSEAGRPLLWWSLGAFLRRGARVGRSAIMGKVRRCRTFLRISQTHLR